MVREVVGGGLFGGGGAEWGFVSGVLDVEGLRAVWAVD